MDPAARLEELLYELQKVMSLWSLAVRLLQLCMVWALLKWLSHAEYDLQPVPGPRNPCKTCKINTY